MIVPSDNASAPLVNAEIIFNNPIGRNQPLTCQEANAVVSFIAVITDFPVCWV